VRNACQSLGVLHVTGATIVSSCEPCAVCHAVAATAGITRIVYAAPREYVPDLGYPAPADNDGVLSKMQQALRAIAPEQVTYVPTEGAEEPFRRFLAGRAASG
jgi:guanine deaminase